MGKSQRDRGKRGERKLVHDLRSLGFGAYRSAQHAGVAYRDDSADVITSIDVVRFEVKHGYNKTAPWKSAFRGWVETAREETPDQKTWMIVWYPKHSRRIMSIYPRLLPIGGGKDWWVSSWVLTEGLEEPLRDLLMSFNCGTRALFEKFKVDNPDNWPDNVSGT